MGLCKKNLTIFAHSIIFYELNKAMSAFTILNFTLINNVIGELALFLGKSDCYHGKDYQRCKKESKSILSLQNSL